MRMLFRAIFIVKENLRDEINEYFRNELNCDGNVFNVPLAPNKNAPVQWYACGIALAEWQIKKLADSNWWNHIKVSIRGKRRAFTSRLKGVKDKPNCTIIEQKERVDQFLSKHNLVVKY